MSFQNKELFKDADKGLLAELGILVPLYLKKYYHLYESPGDKLLNSIEDSDVAILTDLLRTRLTCHSKVSDFWRWIGLIDGWVYIFPYNQGFNNNTLWEHITKNRRVKYLIFKIIEDCYFFKNPQQSLFNSR